MDQCEECMFNVATITSSSAITAASLPAPSDSPSYASSSNALIQLFLIYSAYSVTSAYDSDGTCITWAGDPITYGGGFTFDGQSKTDDASFEHGAKALFLIMLGHSTCNNGGVASVNLLDATISATPLEPSSLFQTKSSRQASAKATSPPLPARTKTSSSFPDGPSSAWRDKKLKVVVVPVVLTIFIAFVAFATMLCLRKRRQRNHTILKENHTMESSQEHQPYLQKKSELEAEETTRYELDGQEIRKELDGANGRHEADAEEIRGELWGGGMSREVSAIRNTRESKEEGDFKKSKGGKKASLRGTDENFELNGG